jgi:hypothetical protein
MNKDNFQCIECAWTGEDPDFKPVPSWCKCQHARCPECGGVVEFILDEEIETPCENS